MKNTIVLLGRSIFFISALLIFVPRVHAQEASQIQSKAQVLESFKNHEDTYQHASSYYDDLVDHYEHDQLMRDEIARGIR